MNYFIFGFFLFVFSSFFWFSSESIDLNPHQAFVRPSVEFILGTDSLGRSYAQRLFLGLRTSLLIVSIASLISLTLAWLVAHVLSQVNSWSRELTSRAVDVLHGIPHFLIVLLLMALFDSQSWLILALLMGLVNWTDLVRFFEAELLSLRAQPFMEASRSLGASSWQVFWSHGWPAIKNTTKLALLIHIPGEILFESSLSFIGFGVQPPNTSLGSLIHEAWPHLSTHPHLLFFPGLVLTCFAWALKPSSDQTLNLKKSTSPSFTW